MGREPISALSVLRSQVVRIRGGKSGKGKRLILDRERCEGGGEKKTDKSQIEVPNKYSLLSRSKWSNPYNAEEGG